ncbi:MAG: hypothetical protein PSN35_00180 [Candidatus Thioglobus sp.]|uniref:hypothetical protein n=1 Tax=Candidatus Thioglobus sp. TaxID=2026721 RepID=UPI002633CD3D|nr:hypothetical protein [Candidatus Thioglobus sp.]MDC9726238.1 hypothetical protein [Candidatus Thioglobus sp.]
MNETEFLIGRCDLDLVDDFYPDDLPSEWRFDYYSTQFKALCLPIDTQEDLELVFDELSESKEVFELVLSITNEQLNDTNTLSSLLDSVADYKADFTLFCELEQVPSQDVMALLAGYRLSFQSTKQLACTLPVETLAGQWLYYNHIPVLYTRESWNEVQMRNYIESVSTINKQSVLICQNAESEALNKIRVIAEILGC